MRTDGDPEAPAIVLVPDGPFVVEHYDSLLVRLGRDYFTVCFDLPGFGFSLPRAGYDHSFGAALSVLEDVLDSLGLARVTLAFTCANGFYALAFASRRPERVARLVQGLWRCRDELFPGVVAPTVMLWGERDRSHRKTDPESLLSLVPQARIVRLPSAGHCPHLEDQDALLAALAMT